MHEVLKNMSVFLYLGASKWWSPYSTSMGGYRYGISPMLRASHWFLSGAGTIQYIDCLLPYTKAYLFHGLPVNGTQWNLGKKYDRNMFEVFIIISIYIYYLRPVTGSLPAEPQWAGTGPESVRCWERRTGSCSVLALCGISKIYYHVLSPISVMSFTWITLLEIWVQNDRNKYGLLMIMSMFHVFITWSQ